MVLPRGPELTEIERQRANRIKENEKRLQELLAGLGPVAGGGTALPQLPSEGIPQPRSKAKRGPVLLCLDPDFLRRSDRVRCKPAPTYTVDDIPDERPLKRPRSLHCAGMRSSSVAGGGFRCRGWNLSRGLASAAAADAALDAAKDCVEVLRQEGRLAYVKLMSESQVSGGFWEQLPRAMHQHYGTVTKHTISLHCVDARYEGEWIVGNAQRSQLVEGGWAWQTVYLPRDNGTGSGLSGGWVFFAIDQRLHPNDTVVFEFMDHYNMRAHLFRANDFETDATRGGAGFIPASTRQQHSYAQDPAAAMPSSSPKRAKLEQAAERNDGREGLVMCDGGDDAPTTPVQATLYAQVPAVSEGQAGSGSEGKGRRASRVRAGSNQQAANGRKAGSGPHAKGCTAASKHAVDPNACGPDSARQGGQDPVKVVDSTCSQEVAAQHTPCTQRALNPSRERMPTRPQKRVKGKAALPDVLPDWSFYDEYDDKEIAAAKTGLPPIVWETTPEELARSQEQDEYVVSKIMDCRRQLGGGWEFKIRWDTFSPAHDNWEPRESLTAPPRTYAWHPGVWMPAEVAALD